MDRYDWEREVGWDSLDFRRQIEKLDLRVQGLERAELLRKAAQDDARSALSDREKAIGMWTAIVLVGLQSVTTAAVLLTALARH